MKQFVTLVVIVALLGALAVSASAATEDTLILKATVAPYAAVWFQNAGIYGTDDHSDILYGEEEKALNFAIDAGAIAAAMGVGLGDGQTVEDFAISQSTTLQVRTNYAVNLGINASAPKATERKAVLRTEIEIDDVRFVGGSQDGDRWNVYNPSADNTYDLFPGETYAAVNLIGLITTRAGSGTSSINLSGWSDAGLRIPFTVSVFPQNYRWDKDTDGYVEGEYTPAFASETYTGSIVATISAGATP